MSLQIRGGSGCTDHEFTRHQTSRHQTLGAAGSSDGGAQEREDSIAPNPADYSCG